MTTEQHLQLDILLAAISAALLIALAVKSWFLDAALRTAANLRVKLTLAQDEIDSARVVCGALAPAPDDYVSAERQQIEILNVHLESKRAQNLELFGAYCEAGDARRYAEKQLREEQIINAELARRVWIADEQRLSVIEQMREMEERAEPCPALLAGVGGAN